MFKLYFKKIKSNKITEWRAKSLSAARHAKESKFQMNKTRTGESVKSHKREKIAHTFEDFLLRILFQRGKASVARETSASSSDSQKGLSCSPPLFPKALTNVREL
jgi:hypothetical protein